jgi:thiol-disulfide isomerase/thioredoxin
LSNVAVIVAAIAFVIVLVRHEWPGNAAPPAMATAESLQGTTVNLASITPSPAKKNLVLFISETCHFCEQEMPFYRTLREKLPGQASFVAVFPPQEPEPAKFLEGKAVKVDHVAAPAALTALTSIGVRGTPTLLLVDEHGKVEKAWIGAQPAGKHEEILQTVERSLSPS